MDMWAVILGIAATLVGFTILAKYTGVLDVVLSIVQHIFNAFRQVLQFVVDHLPKPLKMLLFIALFAAFGMVIYNYSIGATYLCADPGQNVVYQTTWFQGVTFKMFKAGDLSKMYWEDEKGSSCIDSGSCTPDLTGNGTLDPLSNTVTMNNFAIKITNGSELIVTKKGYQSPYDGKTYDLYAALMPTKEILPQLGDGTFWQYNNNDIWNKWFGTDAQGHPNQRVDYYVCKDQRSNACILVRPDNPLGQTSDYCYVASYSNTLFTQKVGAIHYVLKSVIPMSILAGATGIGIDSTTSASQSSGRVVQLSASFEDYGNVWMVSYIWPTIRNQLSTQNCGNVSERDIDTMIADGTYTAAEGSVMKGMFQDESVPPIPLVQQGSFASGRPTLSYSLNLVAARYGGIFRNLVNDTTVTSAAATVNPVTGEVTDTRQSIRAIGFDGATKLDSQAGDVVQIVCANKKDKNGFTTDYFATKPLVAGIDILDPVVMTFFILVGGLISLWVWMKKL